MALEGQMGKAAANRMKHSPGLALDGSWDSSLDRSSFAIVSFKYEEWVLREFSCTGLSSFEK